MEHEAFMSGHWALMTPEFIVLGSAVILSLLDLFLPKRIDRMVLGWLAVLAVAAGGAALLFLAGEPNASLLYETFRFDSFAKAFKLVLMAGVLLILLMSLQKGDENGNEEVRGEYFYLMLCALLGAMMLASSADLITLFVGLELLSVSSYILAGIKKHDLRSNEAAMKYVINGGISTAITLLGMSYLYGVAGTTKFDANG